MFRVHIVVIGSIFLLSPAYAAPVCEQGQYEAMDLRMLNLNLEEIIRDKEKVCIAHNIWGAKDKHAAFGVVGGGGGSGTIDISVLPKAQRRAIQADCEGKTNQCKAAAYGTVAKSPVYLDMWLFVPDRVVME